MLPSLTFRYKLFLTLYCPLSRVAQTVNLLWWIR